MSANSRSEDGASRSSIRPFRVFRRRARAGVQTTGARGMRRRRRRERHVLLKSWELKMRLKGGYLKDWESMREMQRDFIGKRRHCPFKEQNDIHYVSYKRFRRRITQRGDSCDGPSASTPVTTEGRCEPSFDFDTVCQRLELDSPQKHHEPEQGVPQGNTKEMGGVSCCADVKPSITPQSSTTHGRPAIDRVPEQGWRWRAAVRYHGNSEQAASDERRRNLQLFTVLEKASQSLQGEAEMKMAAPLLLNDYYSNLLDCSCNSLVALALGSSVYLWNSETQTLLGHLDQNPQPGPLYLRTQLVSSLCWSRDGRCLCIGTRSGELQLWDVEQQQRVRCLSSHLSVVRAISWKQQLLSSGSIIGHIHHFDPRASTPLVGTAVHKDGICSLQWSPGDDMLASGSTDGFLCVWDSDVAGFTRTRQPVTRLKQQSAVKAMGWCPWQRHVIATGGGWKDGALRIWDTNSATCVSSANTKSQICSLRWAEKRRYLVTGHGLPHHQVTCWAGDFPSLRPTQQLTGHSQRVLHLATNPGSTQIFSAGADQRFHIWNI